MSDFSKRQLLLMILAFASYFGLLPTLLALLGMAVTVITTRSLMGPITQAILRLASLAA